MTQGGAVSTYVLEQGLEGTRGHVHSVFRSSLNVDAGGFLLHVGGDDAPLSCIGMRLPQGVMGVLLERVEVGDLVTFGEGFLRLYCRGGATTVRLEQLEHVDTRVPRLGMGWDARLLERAVADVRFAEGCGLHPCHELSQALGGLSRAASGDGDGAALVDCAAEFLVGRGLGLTPSGDDLLAGFGCACWARAREGVLAGIPTDFGAGRTTDVSVAYLRAMMAGHANEDFVELVRSLSTADEELCRESVQGILSVGHTSGHDSLLGFVTGMGLLDAVGEPEVLSSH